MKKPELGDFDRPVQTTRAQSFIPSEADPPTQKLPPRIVTAAIDDFDAQKTHIGVQIAKLAFQQSCQDRRYAEICVKEAQDFRDGMAAAGRWTESPLGQGER